MKKFKKQKGITLVALIITIVVLLILAMVAIGAVQESNIIGHAQNAAGSYNQAKNNEITEIASAEGILDKYSPKQEIVTGNPWIDERGLTAPVQYDVKYTVTHAEYGTYEVIIGSKGELTLTSPEGTEYFDAETVVEEHGMDIPVPNGNTLCLHDGDSFYVIVDSNTINMYINEVSESNHIMTLTPVSKN